MIKANGKTDFTWALPLNMTCKSCDRHMGIIIVAAVWLAGMLPRFGLRR